MAIDRRRGRGSPAERMNSIRPWGAGPLWAGEGSRSAALDAPAGASAPRRPAAGSPGLELGGERALGARQWLFTHILGATYQRWRLPAGNEDAQRRRFNYRDLLCSNGYDEWYPFRGAPASAAYKPYTYIAGDGKPFRDHWLMVVGGPDPIQRSFQSY
jgi:hypothetical protein